MNFNRRSAYRKKKYYRLSFIVFGVYTQFISTHALNRSEDNNGKRNHNPLGNYSEKIILQSITHLIDIVRSAWSQQSKNEWLNFLLRFPFQLILLKFNSDAGIIELFEFNQSVPIQSFRLHVNSFWHIFKSIFTNGILSSVACFMWNRWKWKW